MGTGTAQISTKPFETQQTEELRQYIKVIVVSAQKYITHTHRHMPGTLLVCCVCTCLWCITAQRSKRRAFP